MCRCESGNIDSTTTVPGISSTGRDWASVHVPVEEQGVAVGIVESELAGAPRRVLHLCAFRDG